MEWEKLDDQQKIKFAQNEYDNYHPNKKPYKVDTEVIIKSNKGDMSAGYVSQVIDHKETGLDAYVITDKRLGTHPTQADLASVKQFSILYQGSSTKDFAQDWTHADKMIAEGKPLASIAQAHDASRVMQETLKTYPNANLYVFAHSLGVANSANALGDLTDKQLKRLVEANLYEGPYVWPLLSASQQEQLVKVKSKILNYIDLNDLISLSGTNKIPNTQEMLGTSLYIDSNNVHSTGNQHMWGGYHFDKEGHLLLNGNIMNGASQILAIRHSRAATAAKAAGGKIALDYAQADSYATYLGKCADKVESIRYYNDKIPNTMEAAHREVKNRMYDIPFITANDVEECDQVNRLQPEHHYSAEAVQKQSQVLKRVQQDLIDLKNKVINTADSRVLHDQQEAQLFN